MKLSNSTNSTNSTHLYHRVPHNLTGSILYPLNVLKDKSPEIYANQVKKYEGREYLLTRQIPHLNCLWNDVLHFSPVHPAQVRAALLEAGFSWKPSKWFVIDPEILDFNSQDTVIYLYPARQFGDFSLHATDFEPFTIDKLSQLSNLPTATIEYYKSTRANNRRPLLFHRVPHILHHGSIDTTLTKTIVV